MDEVAFGRYRLIELMAEGSMGEVWRAHDTVLRRDVAIKILPTELAADAAYRERFQREAYAAAGLNDPNIIPIYEAGEIDGRLYLVMPVVDGVDVHTVLERDGPMSPANGGAGDRAGCRGAGFGSPVRVGAPRREAVELAAGRRRIRVFDRFRDRPPYDSTALDWPWHDRGHLGLHGPGTLQPPESPTSAGCLFAGLRAL